MADNNFDLKGFLNDPKVQADKAGAVNFLQQKGIIDAQGNPISGMVNTPTQASAPTETPFTSGPIGSLPGIKQLNQFGVGLGTSVVKAGLGLGQTFLKGANAIGNFLGTDKNQYNPMIQSIEDVKNVFTKTYQKETASTPGKVGQALGTIAPYVETAGGISNATNATTGLIKGAGLLPAAARVTAGALTEGVLNYGLTYGLTGGNKDEALASGVTAGLLKGGTSSLGELSKGLKFDESLMNKIYKSDKTEQTKELFGKTSGSSLAQEAIDKGLVGSAKDQAKQITTGMAVAEQKIGDEFAKAGNPEITLKNPMRYIAALAKESASFRSAGADEAATKIEQFAGAINDNGKIKATDALALRRLIDGFTNFRKGLLPTTQLSAEQAGFREMGTELRSQINKIGKTGEAMKDYEFYINAKDKLTKYAVKTQNKAALDIVDKAMLGETLFTSSPSGILFTGAKKAIDFRPASTAQFLSKLPVSSPMGVTTRAAIGKSLSGVASSPVSK